MSVLHCLDRHSRDPRQLCHRDRDLGVRLSARRQRLKKRLQHGRQAVDAACHLLDHSGFHARGSAGGASPHRALQLEELGLALLGDPPSLLQLIDVGRALGFVLAVQVIEILFRRRLARTCLLHSRLGFAQPPGHPRGALDGFPLSLRLGTAAFGVLDDGIISLAILPTQEFKELFLALPPGAEGVGVGRFIRPFAPSPFGPLVARSNLVPSLPAVVVCLYPHVSIDVAVLLVCGVTASAIALLRPVAAADGTLLRAPALTPGTHGGEALVVHLRSPLAAPRSGRSRPASRAPQWFASCRRAAHGHRRHWPRQLRSRPVGPDRPSIAPPAGQRCRLRDAGV